MERHSKLSFFHLLPIFILSLHFSSSSVSGGRPQSLSSSSPAPTAADRICTPIFPWDKRRVEVINSVSWGLWLTVHCQSADDDLGVRVLQPGQSFDWTFRSNYRSTLFWCNARWGKSSAVHFDAYETSRDDTGCKHCLWYIKDDGAWWYEHCSNLPQLLYKSTTLPLN